MGLASAQVGFGGDVLLVACLTELIIDTLSEKKYLHEVLVVALATVGLPYLSIKPKNC